MSKLLGDIIFILSIGGFFIVVIKLALYTYIERNDKKDE